MLNLIVAHLSVPLVVSAAFLSPADIFVDASAPSCATGTGTAVDPVCSINAALNIAVNGDTVRIAPGTYVENIELGFAQSVDLIGTGGAGVTIVDGGALGSVLTVPTSVSMTVEGLTLTNGLNTHGGGIDVSGYMTIRNSTITGNRSTEFGGGGIGSALGFGIVNLEGSTISGNDAAYYGGGVFIQAGTLHVTDSTISGNTAQMFGGGIGMNSGRLFMSNSTIAGNTVPNGPGGGIEARYMARVDVESSTFSGNFATTGGGIGFTGADLDLVNCTVSGNTAIDGGGIAIRDTSGIHSLTNVTITGNVATGEGGGLLASNEYYGYAIQVRNSLITLNTNGSDPTTADTRGTFVSLGHNLVSVGGDGFIDGVNGDQVGTPGTPVNAFVLSLADNGGPTQTHAIAPFSPAIDAGDPLVFPTTDQRGLARPQGLASDIGAYEDGLVFGADELCNGNGGNQMGCTNCPCANNAAAGTVGGCLNSSGVGTRLITTGNPSISLPPGSTNDLRFGLNTAPPFAFCILNSGDSLAPGNMASPCFGLDSGTQAAAFDGLRCAIINTRRHGGRSADASGDVGATNNPWGGEGGPGVGIANAGGGFAVGQTRYFQVIHRDDPLTVCQRGLNTSQASEITFGP